MSNIAGRMMMLTLLFKDFCFSYNIFVSSFISRLHCQQFSRPKLCKFSLKIYMFKIFYTGSACDAGIHATFAISVHVRRACNWSTPVPWGQYRHHVRVSLHRFSTRKNRSIGNRSRLNNTRLSFWAMAGHS